MSACLIQQACQHFCAHGTLVFRQLHLCQPIARCTAIHRCREGNALRANKCAAGVAVASPQSAPGQWAGHHQGGLWQDVAGGDAEAPQVSSPAISLHGSHLQWSSGVRTHVRRTACCVSFIWILSQLKATDMHQRHVNKTCCQLKAIDMIKPAPWQAVIQLRGCLPSRLHVSSSHADGTICMSNAALQSMVLQTCEHLPLQTMAYALIVMESSQGAGRGALDTGALPAGHRALPQVLHQRRAGRLPDYRRL